MAEKECDMTIWFELVAPAYDGAQVYVLTVTAHNVCRNTNSANSELNLSATFF